MNINGSLTMVDTRKGFPTMPGTGRLHGKLALDGTVSVLTQQSQKVCAGKASGAGGGLTGMTKKRIYEVRVVSAWRFADGSIVKGVYAAEVSEK